MVPGPKKNPGKARGTHQNRRASDYPQVDQRDRQTPKTFSAFLRSCYRQLRITRRDVVLVNTSHDAYLVLCRFCLREIIQRNRAHGRFDSAPENLDLAHSIGCEQHITADCTDLGRHMIDDDNPISLTHSMHNLTVLILSWATLDTTSHVPLLCVGPTHLGGKGSYTVIIISSGCADVQTTWRGRPTWV